MILLNLKKISAQEKVKAATENRVQELDGKVKELEEQLQSLRERSVRLVDMERRRCLEYVPSKGKKIAWNFFMIQYSARFQSV